MLSNRKFRKAALHQSSIISNKNRKTSPLNAEKEAMLENIAVLESSSDSEDNEGNEEDEQDVMDNRRKSIDKRQLLNHYVQLA